MSARFATTQWSQVLAARDATGTESREALATLCEAYWYPLYAFVRSQGHDADESRDLTQAYFAYLLEKNILEDVDPTAGRFRSFLLASLKHFIANEKRGERTLKRGGGTRTISLDTEDGRDPLWSRAGGPAYTRTGLRKALGLDRSGEGGQASGDRVEIPKRGISSNI